MSSLINNGGVRNWLSKAQFTEDRLNELEKEGFQVRNDSDPGAIQRIIALEDFSEDVRKNAIKSMSVHVAFFCLENSARELVVARLSENYGGEWWDEKVSKMIKEKVIQRQEKEGKNRWHIQRGASPINYTDFGDLIQIIISNWSDFDDLFPDQHWITSRFNDLEASRNIVAHNNILDEREVDRIKMYLTDWLQQVG